MARKDPTKDKLYDRFDLLLVVAFVTLSLLLLVDLDQDEGFAELLSITMTILTAAMLMIAVKAAGIGRRGLRLSRIVVGFTVAASVIGAFTPLSGTAHGGLLWLILVIAAPVIALRRLLHHEKVVLETVLGAVAVYLLMAISATYLFLFIDFYTRASGGFFGTPEPSTVFMYFSLVTITTLGYGDFSPVEVFGRAAAAWISILGQIYLVIVVAYVVAVFTTTRKRLGDSSSTADD